MAHWLPELPSSPPELDPEEDLLVVATGAAEVVLTTGAGAQVVDATTVARRIESVFYFI